MRSDKQLAYRDFDQGELCGPVSMHETIRMLLANVAARDLLVDGADVLNAYLYGDCNITTCVPLGNYVSRNYVIRISINVIIRLDANGRCTAMDCDGRAQSGELVGF